MHVHVSILTVLTVLFSMMIVGPLWHIGAVVATNRGMPIGPAMAFSF